MLCAHIKLPQDVPSTGETNFFSLSDQTICAKDKKNCIVGKNGT